MDYTFKRTTILMQMSMNYSIKNGPKTTISVPLLIRRGSFPWCSTSSCTVRHELSISLVVPLNLNDNVRVAITWIKTKCVFGDNVGEIYIQYYDVLLICSSYGFYDKLFFSQLQNFPVTNHKYDSYYKDMLSI